MNEINQLKKLMEAVSEVNEETTFYTKHRKLAELLSKIAEKIDKSTYDAPSSGQEALDTFFANLDNFLNSLDTEVASLMKKYDQYVDKQAQDGGYADDVNPSAYFMSPSKRTED